MLVRLGQIHPFFLAVKPVLVRLVQIGLGQIHPFSFDMMIYQNFDSG